MFKPYKIGLSVPGFTGLLQYWVVSENSNGIEVDNRAKGIWNSQARLTYASNSHRQVRNYVGQVFDIELVDD